MKLEGRDIRAEIGEKTSVAGMRHFRRHTCRW
jgi:hypothetical protein